MLIYFTSSMLKLNIDGLSFNKSMPLVALTVVGKHKKQQQTRWKMFYMGTWGLLGTWINLISRPRNDAWSRARRRSMILQMHLLKLNGILLVVDSDEFY